MQHHQKTLQVMSFFQISWLSHVNILNHNALWCRSTCKVWRRPLRGGTPKTPTVCKRFARLWRVKTSNRPKQPLWKFLVEQKSRAAYAVAAGVCGRFLLLDHVFFGDLFSWWFSTDSGGKSPFFTTISRNIFPFCSHPTNCNKQIQVSNTARIRFRVPYDPQQISLNQQKHRFISPIRCAFRDEHRFPAGFEFHEKSLWFV